jgi:predicted dehydrogenase
MPSKGDSRVPIRVAVVGYGYGGRTLHVPLIAATDGLEMSLVVSSDPEKVALDFPRLRTVSNTSQAFSDPEIDLVVIATPNDSHAPLAEQAIRAGKHVVVDKPFTICSEDGLRLARLAETSGRILSVYHSRRWEADFLVLKDILASGGLGVVTYFESRLDRYRPIVRDRWRERAEPGAGIWYDLGSHLIDQALQLFGRPQAISADIVSQRIGSGADDYFHAVLFYEQRRVVLHSSCLVVANDLRFVVHGTTGSFIKSGLDPQEAALQLRVIPGSAGWGADPRPGRVTLAREAKPRTVAGPAGDYRRFYAGIRDAIWDVGPNPVPALEAVEVIEIIEAGLKSEATGVRVGLRNPMPAHQCSAPPSKQ